MDGSAAPARSAHYDGPPDYRAVGRHGMFPETTHDEIERLNLLAHMNRHLATRVMPHVKTAWAARVAPALHRKLGRDAKDRHEVRAALAEDPYYQAWSALRRMTMEQRQQAGRWTTLRQAEALAEKAARLAAEGDRLTLDPNLTVPRYVSAVDHHCMPGSYHSEAFPGDVANAANYDHGIFATTGGGLGRYSDGAGQAVLAWVRRQLPGFRPTRILEIGVTVGHSLLPIAQAFPEAEVVGVDVGTPVLRYAAARARAMGVDNVRFVQADGAELGQFADASFDWVQTTMFLHELSLASLKAIFAETHRLLRPGGIVLHVEQPQYTAAMPLFEQAMRDWDAFNNNEPFWSRMHELDMDGFLVAAGFDRGDIIHGGVTAVVDRAIFPDHAEESGEDYGRKAAWHVIGARRAGRA